MTRKQKGALGECHRKGRGARRQGKEGTDGSTKILCFKMP